MAQIKQLTEMRSALPSPMSPMFVPFGSPMAAGGMMEGEGSPFGGGAGGGISSGRLRAVKNRVRDSFKKRRNVPGKTHVIKMDNLEEDFSKIKDFAAKGNIKNALSMLEAISEEFADRVAEISQDNINEIEEALQQLGNHWLDLFLNDSYDLDEDAREDWYEKIRSWDTSAREDGALTTAKWAAKYGWQDDGLKRILEGANPEKDGIEIKEPASLTVARLNILERDKKYQEAYNLANAVNFGLHASKFLMRLNKVDEAVSTALQLSDSSKIYGIAQIARPINLDASFTLGLASLELDWNSYIKERAVWLVDLAIVEKKMDLFTEKVISSLSHKQLQYEIAKLLLSKGRPLDAFELAKKILIPFNHEKLVSIYEKLISRSILPSPENIDKISDLNRIQILSVIKACDIPSTIPSWLWTSSISIRDIAQEQLDIKEGKIQKPQQTSIEQAFDYTSILSQLKDKPNEIVEYCLKTVDHVDSLYGLMNSCASSEYFDFVNEIGSKCLDLIIEQQKIDKEFNEKRITLEFKHEQLVNEAGPDKIIPPFEAPVKDYISYAYDPKKINICLTMLNTALKHKEQFKTQQELLSKQSLSDNNNSTQNGDNVPMECEETEEEIALRKKRIEECSKVLQYVTDLAIVKVSNPDDLLDAAKRMSDRQEYRLALKISHTAFNQVSSLVKQREELDEKFDKFTAIQQEINLLLSQKMKPSQEQIDEYRKLSLERKFESLLPSFAQFTVTQYIRKWYLIAFHIVKTALLSKSSIETEERMNDSEIEKEIEAVLKFVKHPNNMFSLVELFIKEQEYSLIHFIGDKVYKTISNIYEQFLERVPIEIEIQQLFNEQNELSNVFSKELGDKQKNRLEELKVKLESLPKKTLYELPNAESFEEKLWKIQLYRMSATLKLKDKLNAQITSQSTSIDNTEGKIQQLQKELDSVEKLIPSVLQNVIENTKSPFHLYELMEILCESSLDEIPNIAGRSFKIIDELDEESKLLIDPSYEKSILSSEKLKNYSLPPKERKPIPSENIDRLRELELNDAINVLTKPFYKTLNTTQLASLMKKTVILLVKSIQQRQTILFTNLHNTKVNQINTEKELLKNKSLMSDTDLLVHKNSIETYSEKYKEYSEELHTLITTMNAAIEQVISRVKSPGTLSAVANILQNPHVDTFDFIENKDNLKHMRKLYMCIPPIAKELEKIRLERLPIYEEYEILEKEERENLAMLKFPEEKLNRLAELKKQIFKWNSGLSYFSSSADQIDNMILNSFLNCLKSLYQEYSFVKSSLDQLDIEQETAESMLSNQSSNDGDITMSEGLTSEALEDFNRRRNVFNSQITIINNEIETVCALLLSNIENPNNLIKISNGLTTYSSYSLENIIKFCSNVYPKVDSLKKECLRREPLLIELEDLENQQSELMNAGRKSLQGKELKRLEELRHLKYTWDKSASYTNCDLSELNNFNFEASRIMISTTLNNLRTFKTQLATIRQKNMVQETGVVQNVEEIEKIESICLELSEKTKNLVDLSMKYLEDPAHYESLITLVNNHSEYELVFKVGKVSIDIIKKHDDYRQELCNLARKIFIYEAEEYVLNENRQPLDSKRTKECETLKKKFETLPDLLYGVDFEKSTVPTGLPNSATLEKPADSSQCYNTNYLDSKYRSDTIRIMITSILNKKKSYENEIEADENIGITRSKTEIEDTRKSIKNEINQVITYCLDNISNPSHIKTMYNVVSSFGEHDLMILLGEKYIRRIAELRQIQEDKKSIRRQKENLEQKERELNSQRKSLPNDEAETLRDLRFNAKLEEILPSYQRNSISRYDDQIWNIFKQMLNTSLNHKQKIESELDIIQRTPHLVRGKSSWSADQIKSYVDETKTSTTDELNNLINLACEFITNVESLSSGCRVLNEFKQYPELIKLGTHAQNLLKEMVKLKIIYEELSKELKEERENLPPSTMDNDTTIALSEKIEELSLQISPLSQHQLRTMILNIADLMIDAARTEKMYDIVKEESILVFKMTLTINKFEEVRTLVDEKDWEAVRKDLLDYVASYNATLPGSAINTKQQMELLLREGQWREGIQLLPDAPLPSSINFEREAKEYIEMLELLWFEIERIDSDQLKKLLPFIEEFAKKEFAQQRIDSMDRLLDGVQSFYPDFILPLYESGSDMLLSNCSNAKQYKLYCNFALILQRRLLELNKKKDWKAFITEVRQKSKRKTNLIKQLNINELKA